MSLPISDVKKYDDDDEKQAPAYATELDGRRSSIAYINALVTEGRTAAILRLLRLADDGLSR